jgi:hypothetical protein
MFMQHILAKNVVHNDATFLHFKFMHHECRIDMQQGHETWTNSMTYSKETQKGCAAWTCSAGMQR